MKYLFLISIPLLAMAGFTAMRFGAITILAGYTGTFSVADGVSIRTPVFDAGTASSTETNVLFSVSKLPATLQITFEASNNATSFDAPITVFNKSFSNFKGKADLRFTRPLTKRYLRMNLLFTGANGMLTLKTVHP